MLQDHSWILQCPAVTLSEEHPCQAGEEDFTVREESDFQTETELTAAAADLPPPVRNTQLLDLEVRT